MVSDRSRTNPAEMSGLSGAVPVLCGDLVGGQVGPEPVEWALWPVEVYAAGALLRIRVTPLGPWRDYDDTPEELFATVIPPASWAAHHEEIVLATAEGGAMGWTKVDLPNAGVEPGHGDTAWSHSWTLEFWWPREDWLSPPRLSWPARSVEVELPVDPARLEALAAGRPAPPEVTVEAHHPGFDDVTAGPPLGLDAHRPRQSGTGGAAPTGGTRHWPHHDPDTDVGSD